MLAAWKQGDCAGGWPLCACLFPLRLGAILMAALSAASRASGRGRGEREERRETLQIRKRPGFLLRKPPRIDTAVRREGAPSTGRRCSCLLCVLFLPHSPVPILFPALLDCTGERTAERKPRGAERCPVPPASFVTLFPIPLFSALEFCH